MELSKIHQDALVEILNIAIGRAANNLSQMVKDEIHLAIPNASFVSHSKIFDMFKARKISSVDAVSQRFSGFFTGEAMLIFPESDSLKLVQCVIGDMVDDASMTELEQETVTEVGNVVLNTCLGSLSEQLKMDIAGSMPQFLTGNLINVIGNEGGYTENSIVMFIEVSFDIKHKEVRGYLMLIIDLPSAQDFLRRIDEFIKSASGELVSGE